MIYSILFLNPGGSLVHRWRYRERVVLEQEEALVASLIKALIDFGKEAIAAPQRVDFGDYAMSFFLMHTEKGDYWFAALSDAKDPEKATTK